MFALNTSREMSTRKRGKSSVKASPLKRAKKSNTASLNLLNDDIFNQGDNPPQQPAGGDSVPNVESIVDRITQKLDSIVERKISAMMNSERSITSSQLQLDGGINVADDTSRQDVLHAGENTGTGLSGYTASFQTSPAIPLYSSVPLKLKEKIWAEEYIDFSTAFSKHQDSFQVTINENGISSVSVPQSKKFITIEQWTDAFTIFSSVYRQRFPDVAEQLAQYGNTVRGIAKSRGNWHFYDCQFRQLRQTYQFPWGCIHHELYIKALSHRQPFRSEGPRALRSGSPRSGPAKNTCNRYNKGQNCSGCMYAHKCKECFGNHPQFKCNRRPEYKPDKNTSSSAHTGSSQISKSK